MFDLLGVGVCLACISYICCMCTTAFISFGALRDRRKRSRCKPLQTKACPIVEGKAARPRGSTDDAASACSCAKAHRPLSGRATRSASRRKLYLVASSFLDYDDSSENNSDGSAPPR